MFTNTAVRFAALLIAAGVTVPALPSHAQETWAILVPWETRFTAPIAANAKFHFLHVSATPFSTVAVQDLRTQVFVLTENVGLFGLSRTITGLYGVYGGSGRTIAYPPMTGRMLVSNV
jgi:hypothetical protein